MIVQGLSGVGYYLICAIAGLIIFGMAANEWLRLGSGEFRRISLAGLLIFLGRLIGVALLLSTKSVRVVDHQEWVLETLILAAVLWALQLRDLVGRRWGSRFLIATSVAVGTMLLLGLLLGDSTYSSVPFGPWLVTLLISLFALVQWFRHRQHLSLWLGSAWLMSSLSAIAGLVASAPLAMLGHLAMLVLVALEGYRSVLAGIWAFGRQFRAHSTEARQRTQEIAFLLAVSRTLSDSLELRVVLERISEAVARAVDADWAYVLMPVSQDNEQLVVAARYGWWGRRWTQDSHPSRRVVIEASELSLIRHAIFRRSSVLANAPDDYERFECLHDRFARPQSGPALIQPITYKDRTLGILLLGRVDLSPRRQGSTDRGFTDADAQLCQDLMVHVATAIQNARLYQSVVERADREAELRHLQEGEALRLYSFLDSIADGVVVVTEAGSVVLVNAAAERILNVPRQHILGRIVAPLQAALLRTEPGKSDNQVSFVWDDKQLMGHQTPVTLADGTVLGDIVVFRNVTTERRAEEALAEYHRAFSSDLETLLSSIQTDTRLLAKSMEDSATALHRQLLEAVGTRIVQIATLLSDFEALSALEHSTIQIEAQPVNLGSIIDEAVGILHSEAKDSDLKVVVNVPDELRPAWGDPQHLRQITFNLLHYAARRTPAGGAIEVWAEETSVRRQDGYPEDALVVSIRDRGAIMLPEQQQQLFELVHPVADRSVADSTIDHVSLVISKGLVAAHGGQIAVTSVPEEGSTLSFSIPVAEAD